MIKKEVKHIVFDMDLTLVHVRPHTVHLIQSVLEEHGIKMESPQINMAGRWYSKFWVDPPHVDWEDEEHLEENWQSFYMKYLDRYYAILGRPQGSLEAVFADVAARVVANHAEVYVLDEAFESLEALDAKGYEMSVLSNRFNPIAPVIEEMSLDRFFEFTHSAGELGEFKPDKKIFEKHLEIVRRKPKETLYIGDNYWLDVLGAQSAGIGAVLFDRYNWYPEVECPRITAISDLIHLK